MSPLSTIAGRLRNWLREEEGQGLVEYALILVLVAVVVIAAVTLLGPTISAVFCEIGTELSGHDAWCPGVG